MKRATPARRLLALLAPLALLALAAAGCAPSPVRVSLNFPTDDAFMHASQARLLVFALDTSVDADMDGSPDELGLCPELLDRLPTARFPFQPAYDTGLADVCAFRAVAALPEIGQGPHAYLVEVRASDNDLILSGCRVGEIYAGAPDIVVALHPTDAYAERLMTPVTGTPASRCGGAP